MAGELKKRRKKIIIAICYDKGIMLGDDGKFCTKKMNSFLMHHGTIKKEFNKLSSLELQSLINQIKKFNGTEKE